MCSSARWPSGCTRRWAAGERGRVHRRPEGTAPGADATACRALGVSPAWYYKWRDGDRSPRRARRVALAAPVARLFAAHHGRYGSPRITAELRAAGWRVGENTVAQLMAEHGLRARPPRRRRRTTRPGRGRWRAPDLVGRRFAADGVNRRWYGDGTEITTAGGKLHLASVFAMGSRRIVRSPCPNTTTPRWPTRRWRGGRGPRRPGGDRRRGAAHRSGQRVHRAVVPHRLQPVRHHPVDGPARLGPLNRPISVFPLLSDTPHIGGCGMIVVTAGTSVPRDQRVGSAA